MTQTATPPTLPAEAHVGRVSLQVADLDRSRAFYERVIGFTPIELTSDDGHRVARLGPQQSNRWLLELYETPGVRPLPPRGLIGLYHFAILLPERADLGRFIVHATNAGVRMGAADHLVSEALYLIDPDGLQVEVYADRPRASWPLADGRIQLATLPLDFDPIVSAAGRTTWQGLPPATTIGHVHFYVGDIPNAHAFYVDGLGFEPIVTDIPGVLFVAAGGYHHHVGLNTWASRASVATDDDARIRFWELVVPGAAPVEDAIERLTRAGYHVHRSNEFPLAADPWNIVVRLLPEDG